MEIKTSELFGILFGDYDVKRRMKLQCIHPELISFNFKNKKFSFFMKLFCIRWSWDTGLGSMLILDKDGVHPGRLFQLNGLPV